MVCQPKNYIEELDQKYIRLKKNASKDLKPLLDKIDLPSVYLMIMKIVITKGNPTLMPKGATDQQINDLSRKKV